MTLLIRHAGRRGAGGAAASPVFKSWCWAYVSAPPASGHNMHIYCHLLTQFSFYAAYRERTNLVVSLWMMLDCCYINTMNDVYKVWILILIYYYNRPVQKISRRSVVLKSFPRACRYPITEYCLARYKVLVGIILSIKILIIKLIINN